jgi:hypothetical protein
MASFVALNAKAQSGTAWTGTGPGDPGTQTVSGTINTPVDWSSWCTQVTMDMKLAEIEFTNFGSGGFKQVKPGLFEGDLTFDLNQDYAASQVDATVWPLFIGRTLVYFDLMPTNSARSATNPSVVFAGYITEYQPFGTKVGDAVMTSIPVAVTGIFSRLTS